MDLWSLMANQSALWVRWAPSLVKRPQQKVRLVFLFKKESPFEEASRSVYTKYPCPWLFLSPVSILVLPCLCTAQGETWLGQWGGKERQTHGHRQAGIRWSGLPDKRTPTQPEKLSVFVLCGWTEAGLLHSAEQGVAFYGTAEWGSRFS